MQNAKCKSGEIKRLYAFVGLRVAVVDGFPLAKISVNVAHPSVTDTIKLYQNP